MRFRLATADDAPAIQSIYTPVVRQTAISFEEVPPGVEEMTERITRKLRRYPWLVAVETGEAGDEPVLGYAYAMPYRSRSAYRWSVEVSVYVAAAHRRRGVARRLYGCLLALLEAQGYRIAYAVITLPNEASVRLHEGLGFERIGIFAAAGFKLGAWHDVLWMRRGLAPFEDDPAEPIIWTGLDPAILDAALDR